VRRHRRLLRSRLLRDTPSHKDSALILLLGAVPLRLRREPGQPGNSPRRPVHGCVLDDLRQLRVEPVHVRVQLGRFPRSRGAAGQMPLLQIVAGYLPFRVASTN